MTIWYVIAIDWKAPNVVDEFDGDDAKERARRAAYAYDGLALRAIAVPEDDPRVKKT